MILSFEFFPSRSEDGVDDLILTMKKFEEFSPSFFSVTCSEKGPYLTNRIVEQAIDELSTPIAPHLTCIEKSEQEIDDLIGFYKNLGIDRCVAVRGDLPSGSTSHNGHYQYATDLIERLSKDFSDISVGAYPGTHPEAKSEKADIENLKNKHSAGATRALSQFFFGSRVFLDFKEKIEKKGVTIDLVPGILPVVNWMKVQRFAAKCKVPLPISPEHFSVEGMCKALKREGIGRFHFYTLNNFNATGNICRELLN